MFMSFAILHGVQFYVYLTLGDANTENTNLTLTSTQKGNHLTLPRREFIEIIGEIKVRELKFHPISLTNFVGKHWQHFILTAS